MFVRCIDQSEFTVGVGVRRLSHLDSWDVLQQTPENPRVEKTGRDEGRKEGWEVKIERTSVKTSSLNKAD